MKKRLLLVCFCLLGFLSKAQDSERVQSEHQLFIGNSAFDFTSNENNLKLQMQVGSPMISLLYSGAVETSFGFPYGVLYISPTFVTNGFEFSKGYHTDKINIKWELGANQDLIEKINIYRKELGSTTPLQFIGRVSSDVFEFNDTQVEGGVLYKYKVEAVGVSSFDELYVNYIEGIGFRNPTATVTGSVSFDGGSPVQDVIVFAEANGAENNLGSSVKIEDGYLSIDKIEYDIPAGELTLQSWISSHGDVFKFTTKNGKVIKLYAGKSDSSKIEFNISIDGSIIKTLTLNNAYPNGKLNFLGNDVFENISDIAADDFIHISTILESNNSVKFYLNGREITENYISNATIPDGVNTPTIATNNVANYPDLSATELKKVILAENYTGVIDEVRVWQRKLTDQQIRRDYRRYLGGGETDLSLYLRMDEKTGNNVYDLSRKGYRQNKNDGVFVMNSPNGLQFSDQRPTQQQLGVFGVTDANGSYTISSISYSGTGESFVITPSLGVHKFEPTSQTLFLGTEASIVNQLNFRDISSFKFNGRAVYNVQNVFNSIPLDATEQAYTNIEDYGYNQYRVNGTTLINKGQYYYEGGTVNSSNGFYEGGVLKKYPVIGLENAYVYIDGNIVIDADNQPVKTDSEGNFSINVPIGKHKIEIRKDGHTFAYAGYFPTTNTWDFFEDQLSPTWFIDTTRISLIGKVVGGKIASEKPLGFGLNGTFSHTNYEGENNESIEVISPKNNIGTAQITFKGDINTATFDVTTSTNAETGEYKVDLIPYIYYIKTADLNIPSNPDIAIIDSNETLNLLGTPRLDSIAHTTKDGTELYSISFHHKKSFRYNSPVTLTFLDQEYEKTITTSDLEFDVSDLETPIYKQKGKYKIHFEVSQNYVNKDGTSDDISKEFFTEGTLNINNNLEISGRSTIKLIENNKKYEYQFQAGEPNTNLSEGFKNDITVSYNIPGSNPLSISNIVDFKSEGIIKGGAKTGGTAFATIAPRTPDIILRDPPGSNSYASIEKGTTISFTENKSSEYKSSKGGGLYASIGPEFEFSIGGLAFFTATTTTVVANDEMQMTHTTEEIDENTSSKSYTFNQTISTSDSPSYVGADGDLYIGNAKNVYYGTYNKVGVMDSIPKNLDGSIIDHIQVMGKNGLGEDKPLYIYTKRDFYIGEQATSTFFVYSQKYILETLIPRLEELAVNYTPPANSNALIPTRTSQSYLDEVESWKKIIQQNEKIKYRAKNSRNNLKESTLDKIDDEFGDFKSEMSALFNDHFFSNQSFDAGVGAITNSIATARVNSYTVEKKVDFSTDFRAELGFLVNEIGAVANYTSNSSNVDVENSESLQDLTTNISYTLKDNDSSNELSVDVVNSFDGNGPIFITKAGSTSCPYEGATKSHFYKKAGYNSTVIGNGNEILSDATNKVYLPEVKSDKVQLNNIPESEGALFNLKLKNKSETQTDLEYLITVDALTLQGATSNVDQNGVKVYLPFNETIDFPFEVYKSSASSTFNYENIRVYLSSPCTSLNSSNGYVDLSVEFKKSCSKVAIQTPQDNWIFNKQEGFSIDTNGLTTNNKLPISISDFNTDFNGFQKIELQYRNASSANWIKLQSYYGSQALLDAASDSTGELISSADADKTYLWDIIGNKIPDGNYELRAISYCTDNVSYQSDIIQGVINLNAPVLFGTPQPSDGILDVGEDITVRYNEAIFERGATNIKLSGLSNQQVIDHSVSVYLDGGNNTVTFPNQILQGNSFTLQFWFKNATTGAGKLLQQENGIEASLNGNELTFSIAGQSVTASINPTQYNFYSLVYQKGAQPQLLIHENGTLLESTVLTQDLDINTRSNIVLGGANTKGNIHDIRLWSKPFTPAQATVAKDKTLSGKELQLLGYWPLDEGHGTLGVDKAKSRNAIVNLGWDIKPKGTAYRFEGIEHLELDNVNFVQAVSQEDITLSMWVKTNGGASSTLFSNGKGNDQEIVQSDGYRNKWAINLKADGTLELASENINYTLTNTSITDGKWHHIAIVVKRGGAMNTYVDGLENTSISSENIGGIVGNKFAVGARLYEDSANNESIDNYFTGQLDEIRLWNTARSFEQVKRDRFFEVDPTTEGLLLYMDFNQANSNSQSAPKYNHVGVNNSHTATFAIASGNGQNYSVDGPPLKPKLHFTNIPFSTVINGDQLLLLPELTKQEWSLYEGQTIDISVSRMYDEHFNEQLSPISWTAFVNKQEIAWFTADNSKEITIEKQTNSPYSFTMDILNKGGSNQNYSLSGIPTWLQTDNLSGTVAPNSSKQLVFTVDQELAMGNYNANIFMETDSEFNDRLSLKLRVLTPAPDWSVNPVDYFNSMNIIGKIKINNTLSRDAYTKIGAFVGGEKRGEAYLQYDTSYDSYFVYLTVYSNTASDEVITFKIWDAVNGKTLVASIDNSTQISYLQNEVLGYKSNPKLFAGALNTEQSIALYKGWTWTSFYVNDSNFSNLKNLFDGLSLTEGDMIKSQNLFSNYENGNWFGNLVNLNANSMYKIKMSNANNLRLSGSDVDETNINLSITEGWNWLAFPIHKNMSLAEALTYFNPSDGDVIKDQFSFAIYDTNSGWSGTLNYLQVNRGYMLRSNTDQTINFPNTNSSARGSFKANRTALESVENFAKYAYNMNIVAELPANNDYTKISLYDTNGELRGSGDVIKIDDRQLSFITVFSDVEEVLKLRLSNDKLTVQLTQTITFKNNEVLGAFDSPVLIQTESLDLDEMSAKNIRIYPNPFEHTINIDSSKATDKLTKIALYSVVGALIEESNTIDPTYTIDTKKLAQGVYLLKIITHKGTTIVKKIIKE
jgi:hypothetical protein